MHTSKSVHFEFIILMIKPVKLNSKQIPASWAVFLLIPVQLTVGIWLPWNWLARDFRTVPFTSEVACTVRTIYSHACGEASPYLLLLLFTGTIVRYCYLTSLRFNQLLHSGLPPEAFPGLWKVQKWMVARVSTSIPVWNLLYPKTTSPWCVYFYTIIICSEV